MRPMATTDTAQQRALLSKVSGIGFYSSFEDLPKCVINLLSSGEFPEPIAMAEHTYEQRCLQLLRVVSG